MRTLILIAIVAIKYCASIDSELDNVWEEYKNQFQKQYEDDSENQKREIWESNRQKIIEHNEKADAGESSFRLSLNKLADMTDSEIEASLYGYSGQRINATNVYSYNTNISLPREVDWRNEGYVTRVKDQAQCGSCWAFSATGSLEGQYMKVTGELVSLSEQNLLDCSREQGNLGCDGGLMNYAFTYIMENRGIDTEESYPYEAEEGECRFERSSVGARITGYVDIPSGDESALKNAVANVGPISVAMDASQFGFHFYSEGIFDEPECSSTELDHAVLAVGYGTEDGKDYWLMKNSWGEEWGEAGYVKMSRNKDNQCGIATQSSFPLVKRR